MTSYHDKFENEQEVVSLTFLLLIQRLIESKYLKFAGLFLEQYIKDNQSVDISELINILDIIPEFIVIDAIKEIDELIYDLREKINNSEKMIQHEVQKELSNLLRVCAEIKTLVYCEQNQNSLNIINRFIPNLQIAFSALNKYQNITLATIIRRDIEASICKITNPRTFVIINSVKHFLGGVSTPAKVLTGLFIALPIHLIAPYILSSLLNNVKANIQPIFVNNPPLEKSKDTSEKETLGSPKDLVSEQELDEFIALLILSAIAGSSGSVISIISRLNEYRSSEYDETLFPVFVGAFKPMIGGFMGMFLFAFMNSQLLPVLIPEKPENKWFAVMSLSFLIGFSERFANDLISQAENKVSSNTQGTVEK